MEETQDLIIYCIDAFEPAEELRRRFAAKFPNISIHKSAGIMDFYCTLATYKFRAVVIIACQKIPYGAKYTVKKLCTVGYTVQNQFVYHFKPSTIGEPHKSMAAEFTEDDDGLFFAAVKNAAEKDSGCRWITADEHQ